MALSAWIIAGLLVFLPWVACGDTPAAIDPENLLKKMEEAYSEVKDYQALVEVKTFGRDGSFQLQRFRYTFKKPKQIRLDFETPHQGMVIVYPDRNGKVVVHQPGLTHFFKLHLSPNNPLLEVSSGQRVDQTDLGLLIENISHSLTNERRGRLDISEDDGKIRVQVLADDHFRKGVETLYHFIIDKALWLPVKVEEYSPDRELKRTITFHHLKTNIAISESEFELNGG